VTEKSTAAVLVGKEQIEIRRFSVPDVEPDSGILRVSACGVCGFDNEAYLNGGNKLFRLPCVCGHEVVGTIVGVGDEAAQRWRVKEGDQVVIEEYVPCGACLQCLTGNHHLCFEAGRFKRYGAMRIDEEKTALWGGYSDYMYLHPRSIIHKVDPDAPADLLSLFIPISNGLHWTQEVARVRSGDTVVIQGPGPMGLGSVIGAKEAGAGTIIVTGLSRDEHRLRMAEELGADHTLLADSQSIVKEVREITNGGMASVVINVAPTPQAIAVAAQVAAPQATIVETATEHGFVDRFVPGEITWKLLTIKGVLGRPPTTVRAALRLIASDKYPLRKMLTHKFPVEEAERAIRTASFGEDNAVHVSVIGG
jgi:threonine dehydrogenase-like Zn-dependent dehydrogenase